MRMKFANEEERSIVIRRNSLLRADLSSYAAAAGSYVAIQRCEGNTELLAKLNLFPVFWNSVIASLQHKTLISLSRIHDNGKGAYLSPLLKALKKNSTSEVKAAGNRLATVIETHQAFIEQCVKLRNNLFAHTNFHAPLHATFGFEGLTVDMFESYWNDIAAAAKDAEESIFGLRHGPQIDIEQFKKTGDETLRFLINHHV